MLFNLKTLALINLSVQFFLILLLNYAAFLAKKRNLHKHCTIIRIAAGIQIAAIVAVMWGSMLGYLGNDAQDFYRVVNPSFPGDFDDIFMDLYQSSICQNYSIEK